jgi:alkylation response protein AidB-like acyl-CoA dehydrogenase
MSELIDIDASTSASEAAALTKVWVEDRVPLSWREAAREGGRAAIRSVRSRTDYEAWYPTFGRSGLVVPTWPVAYGGLDVSPAVAKAIETELSPYNLAGSTRSG